MRKILGAALLGLVLLLLLSAARPAAATHGDLSGLYGGNLRVSVRGPLNLNPFTATDADSWKVIPLVYDSLARIDPVTQLPAPWAAASWSVSGSTLTVTMRSDLAFHDGSAETASDVIYSYNQYKSAGKVPSDLAVAGGGSTVTLSSASAGGLVFGQDLLLPIVKSGSLSNPVGGGPWKLQASTATSWTLAANAAHFWPPYLDTVTFSVYADTSAASLALLSGNLDFIGWGLSVDDPGTIYNIGGTNRSLLFDATIVNNPGFTQLVVGFNLRGGRTTSDSEFRLALADTLSPLLARQAHANTIVSRSPVINEAVPWFNPNLPIYQVVTTEYPAPTYLLTDQNQRLDSAGYFDRNGDGIREKPDGSPLSLVAIGIPVAESSRIFTIQASTVDVFSRLGLAVSLESVPSASLPTRLASGNFDVFIASLPTDLDPGFLSDYFGSAGSKNYVHVLDSALDTSLQSANVALATASRQSAVMSVQDRVMNGGYFVPLIHFNALEATVRGSFAGWVNMPGGVNNFWTYQKVHVSLAGSLAAGLTILPTSVKAGATTTAIAKVTDAEGAPVSGAAVSFWIAGSQVASGTTDGTGTLSTAITAPSAQGATDVQVTIQASKLGYAGATTSAWMTVTPDIRALAVAVTSSAVTIAPGTPATITVTVTSGGSAVSGATVSLDVIGLGGKVAAASGTTDVQGKFTTTFTADVGPRTQFRVVATVTATGHSDGTGSTTVIAEQRVGTVEPRVIAGLDTTTIIVAVLALVVIGAIAAMMGRKK